MKKTILSLATMAMLLAPSTIQAQNFDDYFVDKTLRVDYTFAGNKQTQMIAVDQLNVMPRWYGKQCRSGRAGCFRCIDMQIPSLPRGLEDWAFATEMRERK